MSPHAIDRELERYRAIALEVAELLAAGVQPSELPGRVRTCMDDLICLIEEVPGARRAEIEYLIDRFDDLQKRTLN